MAHTVTSRETVNTVSENQKMVYPFKTGYTIFL